MGEDILFRHGQLRVSIDRRYLEHLDGTPFFWLGDAWWMGPVVRQLSKKRVMLKQEISAIMLHFEPRAKYRNVTSQQSGRFR